MAPAKRIPGRRDWPKYLREPRPGYFTFDNPLNGQCIVIGRVGEADAKKQARAAELWVAEQREQHGLLSKIVDGKSTFAAWTEEYFAVLERDRDLASETTKAYRSLVKRALAQWKDLDLRDIETKEVADLLNSIRASGKETTARQLRKLLKDIFKVAEANGRIERGHNPAILTYNPKIEVARARLTFEAFRAIYAAAANEDQWVQNSMLLALVSAQRRDDVAKATFKPTKGAPMWQDGAGIFVEQGKTGARLVIPAALRLDCLGVTLQEVISRCRTHVVSKYMIHHARNTGTAKPGENIHPNTLARVFAEARGRSGLTWEDNTPPSFHEIRSLSIRLYEEQGGVDVQALAGHKDAATTALYKDSRGIEFKTVRVK